ARPVPHPPHRTPGPELVDTAARHRVALGMRATSTLTALIGAAGAVRLDAPVEPESDEARRLILDELSRPQYAAAQPTWFDQLASAVWDWLTNLRLEGATIEFGLMALI